MRAVREYLLEREQWLPADPDAVFEFFSDAANLAWLTPPWLELEIHTPLPVEKRVGLQLDYTIRLWRVPVRWRTRFTSWDPPHGFVDVEERGPYALWEHTHVFRPEGEGVRVIDRVRYALPLGPLGRLAQRVAVGRILTAIFDYRARRIRERFS